MRVILGDRVPPRGRGRPFGVALLLLLSVGAGPEGLGGVGSADARVDLAQHHRHPESCPPYEVEVVFVVRGPDRRPFAATGLLLLSVGARPVVLGDEGALSGLQIAELDVLPEDDPGEELGLALRVRRVLGFLRLFLRVEGVERSLFLRRLRWRLNSDRRAIAPSGQLAQDKAGAEAQRKNDDRRRKARSFHSEGPPSFLECPSLLCTLKRLLSPISLRYWGLMWRPRQDSNLRHAV